MQGFALYLRGSRPISTVPRNASLASDVQRVLLYGATTLSFFTALFAGARTVITDASGDELADREHLRDVSPDDGLQQGCSSPFRHSCASPASALQHEG